MLKKLLVACVVLGAVLGGLTGCKGKSKATDQTSGLSAQGGEGVDSTPMNFDAQGSDSGRIDGLKSIFFGYDQSNLSAEARATLKSNADWIKANPSVRMQIEGHCDNRGTIEYNISLGERRANAVKSYLISMGIKADRLSTISYGEEKPLANSDSDSDMARNRRANFVPVQ
ncbi:MAG: peptidoglycan-associated lipoprotein Pal [Pseudobdellovibrionaceae bacterium]